MNDRSLENPTLVAVWPGISGVAISAGYYMLAKLGMTLASEFSPSELFEVEYVDVEDGLIRSAELPRSRLFTWKDPKGLQDIVLFIGDAQPPSGKFTFCRRLIDRAVKLGVRRVFTFAAMATAMTPDAPSRVFSAATEPAGLRELDELQITRLQDGRIGGLNGVLLAAAADKGIPGICLLGETPHTLTNLTFPKASLAVLQAFEALTGVQMDLSELSDQAQRMEQELKATARHFEGALRDIVRKAQAHEASEAEDEAEPEAQVGEPTKADRERIDDLFSQAGSDRARAYELKAELDRLGVFEEYEDRFLDLFKEPED